MLQESNCFQKIYIACVKTDLRKGIDGLADLVKHQFQLEPYQKNVLFLFCGTKSDRIKGLVWEGDGYLLLYKRIADGRFRWPRNSEEAAQISQEQYHRLLEGLEVIETPAIRKDVKYREVL